MYSIKNIHFTLLIRIDGRLHEFNFRKRPDDFYDVDTSDSRGNRIQFRLVQKENEWQLEGSNIPNWISTSKQAIADAVEAKSGLD